MQNLLRELNLEIPMNEEIEEPKDLGLKMGTNEEAAWAKILKAQEGTSLNAGINKEIADTLVILAEQRIAEEKEKFKKQIS